MENQEFTRKDIVVFTDGRLSGETAFILGRSVEGSPYQVFLGFHRDCQIFIVKGESIRHANDEEKNAFTALNNDWLRAKGINELKLGPDGRWI